MLKPLLILFAVLTLHAGAHAQLSGAEALTELKLCAAIPDSFKRLICFEALAARGGAGSTQESPGASSRLDSSSAKSVSEAMSAVRKLQSRVQLGLSFNEYPSLLSEAKLSLDAVLREHGSSTLPAPAEHLRNAVYHYETALRVWRIKFADPKSRASDRFGRFEDDRLYDGIRRAYPSIPENTSYPRNMHYADALAAIWAKAAEEIELADAAMSEYKSRRN